MQYVYCTYFVSYTAERPQNRGVPYGVTTFPKSQYCLHIRRELHNNTYTQADDPGCPESEKLGSIIMQG